MLFGASILTACNQNSITLTLSKETAEIQIYAGETDGYEIITAQVFGTNEASISANAKSGYENIVKVTTTPVTKTSANIKIEGLNEGSAEIAVKAGSQTKYIHATVFSEVSSMTQKTEDGEKENFLIRGQDNVLNENNLIEFTPNAQSRRTISWSLPYAYTDVTLNENVLTIGENFIGDDISLIATTEKGVMTSITLPVLDPISNDITMGYSYSKNSTYTIIDDAAIKLVPNVSTDEKYQVYILVDYIGDLEISGYALDSKGNPTEDIVVNREGSHNDRPLFVVYANKEKANINDNYMIGFKIGYRGYHHQADTINIRPITIEAREMINAIVVSTKGSSNIENSIQTLYSEYADSVNSSVYGQEFKISMTPTTVIDASNKYSITMTIQEAGGAITQDEACPIEIWYRDVTMANAWRQIELEFVSGHYVVKGSQLPTATTIYIKATSKLAVQTVEGIKLTFTSEDNPNVSTYFNLKLVRSVSRIEFKSPEGDFLIDSSIENTSLKKQFTLIGQSSIEGLYIINNSDLVTFSEIKYISNDEESVTFEVEVILKKVNYGMTQTDTYYIAHRNGLQSEQMLIDIFLPLKEASIYIDNANSVVDSDYNNETYDTEGEQVASDKEGLSAVMLKNNTTTPVIYAYNEINGFSAIANVSVNYFDFVEREGFNLEDFIALQNSPEGVLEIINNAKGNDTSGVCYIANSSIVTKAIGRTFAVVFFEGKSAGEMIDNVGGQAKALTAVENTVTFIRIVRIESLITPDGMSVSPENNKIVNLYSMESLASSDSSLTEKAITIKFAKDEITYKDISNLQFYSRNEDMGEISVSGDGRSVSWAKGRYTLSNVSLTKSGITFTIGALHTFGDHAFTDTLDVHYQIKNAKDEKVYDISCSIKITISNAQRIEEVKWDNFAEEGLYFELGDTNPQYLLFKTSPTNAKNKKLAYILTDEAGNDSNIISITETSSEGTLSVNLNEGIDQGKTCYIYILPADAIYNNQIKYYYIYNGEEQEGYISPSILGAVNSYGMTNYEYLIQNAYFKSNVSVGEEKNVDFSEILLKIKVEVADGRNFEHAYRIYDEDAFCRIGSVGELIYTADRYYTIMTSLEVKVDSSRQAITNIVDETDVGFLGGIQGYDDDVTITLNNGANFANVLGETCEIRNIKFNGIVQGEGFIANINNGKITDVTIDTYGICASHIVTSITEYAGGFVAINNGTINGGKVLGLEITAPNATIGGIAGKNNGTITNCAVEFYNLSTGGVDEYASNKFTGANVGAIAGEISNNSTISYSYAYDYMLTSSSDSVLVGVGVIGSLVGIVNVDGDNAIIDYCFAVVGQDNLYGNVLNGSVNCTNFYNGYHSAEEYLVQYSENYIVDGDFVKESDTDFDSEINNGKAYLKNLQQPKRVTSVAYDVQRVESNGYYKSVAVGSQKGILFHYALKNSYANLNNAENNDLQSYNTITLAELVEQPNISENIIITSSDVSVVKVIGSTLLIRKTGDVTLTLSSKQNVQHNYPISIKVVSPLSQMTITWTDYVGDSHQVVEDSQLSIQKTRSRDFSISYDRTQVYLGTLANSYEIVENNLDLGIKPNPETSAIASQKINSKEFKLISQEDSVLTTFNVYPIVFANNVVYQTAIENEFTRTFKVLPTDGVISFMISGEKLPITPSVNASIKAKIKTTENSDNIYPVITQNGMKLTMLHETASNIYQFALVGETTPIIEAVVSLSDTLPVVDGVNTYIYDINFAVAEGYKANIADQYQFDVYLMSQSGNSSKEWGAEFTLDIAPQNFTNIDVSNRKITSTNYQYNASLDKYVESYTAERATSVLAPGNSSILQINVNPEYSFYDYVELSYSGAQVSNAVNMVVVEPLGNAFTKKAIDGNNIETINSKLIYRPTNQDKKTVYFKLWINTTINRDTILCFTASFYKNGKEEALDYVNYYLTVSYLTEPTITVDGANITYLAKGSSAEVKIEVLADQKIDNLLLEGDGLKGVTLSQLGKPKDTDHGTKIYTTTVYSSVIASSNENNVFYIKARVSREINGSKEIKESTATIALVDFKIDENTISIANTNDNNLTIWQGVSKPFMVEYDILPESYPYPSTPEMEEAIKKLQNAREDFLANEYYPVKDASGGKIEGDIIANSNLSYLINYTYNKTDNVYNRQSLYSRLYVEINDTEYPVSDSTIELPFEIQQDPDGKLSFKGTKISGSVSMILKTYITAGFVTREIKTYFTVTVKAYSDPDLPIKISNASDFLNLNPDSLSANTDIEQNDYILENDILLENYTSFNTDLISSFDGNGHTIYIKSFDLENQESSTINLALFKNVKESTTLKNVRVNLYNGGQLTINVAKFKTINVAGLAISNEGVITNCEVVSFYTQDYAMGESLADKACDLHNNPQGININYFNANGMDSVYLTENANWTTQVAGFVIENSGSITNSHVGGDEIIIIGEDRKDTLGQPSGRTYASMLTLDTFHIVGQGNIAGFVLNNTSGYITASVAKNVDIENQSNSIAYYSAGFVGVNNSAILASFIEGKPSDESTMTAKEYCKYAFEGSSIRSKLGYIAGFVYSNVGTIKDSYSNILIANSIDASKVYYASGFVYSNEGSVENCYSASQIENSKYTQMNFSGVNERGDLLKYGDYINCYFFNKAYYSSESSDDLFSTESQYATGAQLIGNPTELSAFYGFAIAEGENDGIWRADDNRGLTLIEANKVTVSHRYTSYVDETFNGIAGEDEHGRKYILPYAVLTFVNASREIDTTLGSDNNPILVYDAQDFMEITGTSASQYVQAYFNEKVIWGSYRLVNNIDLLTLANKEDSVALSSTSKAFAGRLYGNGFKISGISISADSSDSAVAFGLFKSIEKRKDATPIVTNLDIAISQVVAGDVSMVGGLAGYIKDAIIINIDIDFEGDGSMITGLNFVGGLAGLATGRNVIKNINITNPTTRAERRADVGEEDVYLKNAEEIKLFRTNIQNSLSFNTTSSSALMDRVKQYSFAGSLIGFVDNYQIDNFEFVIGQANNYSINNVRVSGKVNVQGQIVGGIIGFTGYQTAIRDIGLTINTSVGSSKILSTKYFAGGLIGQSFGSLSRAFAVHDKTTQDAIEDNMSSFYKGNNNAPRGVFDIFSSGETNYTQKFIGGLIGYVGSGKLEIAYSKLNVTATSAEYAGGVVGGVDANATPSYQTNASTAYASTYTKYFMNEVYATGDVRASVFAGGIIGAIMGENSKVALLSVNAVNYFSAYDYETGEYITLGDDVSNMSALLRANMIVGHLIDDKGDVLVNVDENNFEKYVVFVRAGESFVGDGTVTIKKIPSVGYYEGFYETKAGLVTMNILGSLDGRVDENNALYKEEDRKVFAISKPSNYADSFTGHTYTQTAFLNSGCWSSDYWVHNTQDLFPSIRYKRSYEVIYLDCYNIEQVFSEMSGKPFVKVIVRGRITTDNEACADINLAKYFVDDTSPVLIEGFAGILQGGGGQIEENGEWRDVKIITDRPFIKSTGEGFSLNNLTIDYVDVDREGNVCFKYKEAIKYDGNGLLTLSEMSGASISNLTMNIKAPIEANTNTSNFGIIAPTIRNTDLSGININSNLIPDDANESTLLLTVNSTATSDIMNVGLIAGTATQANNLSTMTIEYVKISIQDDAMKVTANEINTLNTGLYFGQISKEIEAQTMKVMLDSLEKKNSNVSDDQGETAGAGIIVGGTSLTEIYTGGYIGKTLGAISYSFNIEEELKTEIDFKILSTNSNANAYVGGIIGCFDALTLSGSDKEDSIEIKTKLLVDENAKLANLYAGGVVGGNGETVANLTLKNFQSIDFDVRKLSTNVKKPSKESLSSDYGENLGYVTVTNEADVGVIAGKMDGVFEFISDSIINKDGSTIRVEGGKINLGSVIGKTGSTATINGYINSNAQFMVGGTIANVGGIVGLVEIGEISVGAVDDGPILFQGGIYSEAKTLVAGGIVGNAVKETARLNISNTVFGGTIRIHGENSQDASVTTGGTIGNIANTIPVTMTYNYNYGDVFVQYNNTFTELTTYNFGGLIGKSSALNAPTIENNYSLVSSHNSKYSSDSGTAKALYGNGSPFGENPFSTSNYYNHAVSLLVDDLGIDMGYAGTYNGKAVFGYGDKYDVDNNIKTIISNKVSGLVEIEKGHKLNPASFNSAYEKTTFNGLYYYLYDGENNQLSITVNEKPITELKNVAIIGSTAGYENDYTSVKSLVDVLAGYSSISGFARNVNVQNENAEEKSYYSPLVGTLKGNAMVYAINLTGSYELGGDKVANIGGIVGDIQGGKIYDCSTDIDIVYRAGVTGSEQGNISALANNTKGSGLIENCYTSGSITTLLKANIYAFANGSESLTINNCFTYTKLEAKDYLNATTQYGTIGLFGNAKLKNTFYDIDGLIYDIDGLNNGEISTTLKTLNDEGNEIDACTNRSKIITYFDENKNLWWTNDLDFNFGYPTLKYQYLKTSSYLKFESSSAQGDSGYDYYVKTNSYSRYSNGTTPSGENYYYYIPNRGVLYNLGAIDGIKGYVLRYDIDMSVNQYSISECFIEANKQKTLGDFGLILDGQNKTISGLTNSLFGNINGGSVSNLRLTQVNIKNAPALASIIKNATISNMTFSGDVKFDNNNGTVGAIANTAIDSTTINTTTNMINLSYISDDTSDSALYVGGFVGNMGKTVFIYYSSNYGNIDVERASNDRTNYVGGLAGIMSDASAQIYYSYNAGTILGNYKSTKDSSNDSSNDSSFAVGGLVGCIRFENGVPDTNIGFSYNSGMIKAGNKSNTKASYAGGIVGIAYQGIIYNVYNEGKVEALGKDPSWEFKIVDYEQKDEKGNPVEFNINNTLIDALPNEITYKDVSLRLYIPNADSDGNVQRNVYAYGIGYLENDATTSKSSTLADSGKEYEYVKNNGTTYVGTLKEWKFKDVYKEFGSDLSKFVFKGENEWRDSWRIASAAFYKENNTLTASANVKIDSGIDGDIDDQKDNYYDKNDKKFDQLIASYNEFGIPSRFYLPLTLNVKVKNYYEYFYTYFSIYPNNYSAAVPRDMTEYAIFDFDFDEKLYDKDITYNNYQYGVAGNFASNKSGNTSVVTAVNNDIKKNTRSAETESDIKTTKVNGQTYYIADSNNVNTIFNAGVKTYKFTGENALVFEDVPYINDINYYTLSEENLGNIKIASLSEDGNGVKVETTIYSSNEISSFNFRLDLNYQKSINLDLSAMKYVAIDDYSFGIEVDDMLPNSLKGYSLTTQSGTEYNNVVKLSLDDKGNSLIYLAVDGNKYVYAPHATLSDGKATSLVNTDYIAENAKLDLSNTNEIITNIFSGKTLYYKIEQSGYKTQNIIDKVSLALTTDEKEFKAGASSSQKVTLQYGKAFYIDSEKLDITYHSDEIPPIVEGEDSTYSNYYTFTLPTFDSDVIGIYDRNPIMSFSKGTNVYSMIDNIELNGETYNLSINGNEIKLEGDNITGEDSQVINAIKEYFRNTTFIANDFTYEEKLIEDQYPDITLEEKTIEIKKGETVYGKITMQHTKNWLYNGDTLTDGCVIDGIKFEKTVSGFSLKIDGSETSSLNFYEFGGVKIYNGEISPSIKQEYYTSYGSAELFFPKGEKDEKVGLSTYYRLDFTKASTNSVQIYQGIVGISPGGHTINNIELNEEFKSGMLNIKLSYYNTYKEKSYSENETGAYALALQDEERRQYFANIATEGVNEDRKFVYNSLLQVVGDYALQMNVSKTYETDGTTLKYTDYNFAIYTGEAIDYSRADINSILEKLNITINGSTNTQQIVKRVYADSTVKYLHTQKKEAKDKDGNSIRGTKMSINQDDITIEYDNKSYIVDVSSLCNKSFIALANEEVYRFDAYSNSISCINSIKIGENVYNLESTSEKQIIFKNDSITEDDETQRNAIKNYISMLLYIEVDDTKEIVFTDQFDNIEITDIESSTIEYNSTDLKNAIENLYEKYQTPALTRYENSDYIFSENYQIIESISFKDAYSDENLEFYSSIDLWQDESSWEEFKAMPTYSIITESKLKGSVVALASGSRYESSENEVKIYLKGGDQEKITFTLDNQTEIKNRQCNPIEGTEDTQSIILVDDISFVESLGGNAGGANIIGNGYYMSFYGSSLFDTLFIKESSIIKDLSLLGEVYGNNSFINAKEDSGTVNKLTFSNVALYGSVNNLTNSSAIINGSNSTMTNLSSYISINGGNSQAMYLFDACVLSESITNYGIITGANGKKGANGDNIQYQFNWEYMNKLLNAENGDDGQSIKATSDNTNGNTITNKGVIIAGNGGNAGAGGSRKNDDAGFSKVVYQTAGTAGNCGTAGTILGFSKGYGDVIQTEGDTGKSALIGCRPRAPYLKYQYGTRILEMGVVANMPAGTDYSKFLKFGFESHSTAEYCGSTDICIPAPLHNEWLTMIMYNNDYDMNRKIRSGASKALVYEIMDACFYNVYFDEELSEYYKGEGFNKHSLIPNWNCSNTQSSTYGSNS